MAKPSEEQVLREKRLDKKELRRDRIREQMLLLTAWAIRRRGWIFSGVGLVLVVLVLVFTYAWQAQRQAEAETRAFYAVEKALESSEATQPPSAGRKQLQRFLDAHPDAPLNPIGWMYLGGLEWEAEQREAARQAFERVLAHPRGRPYSREQAIIAKARLAETAGKYDDAVAQYALLPDKPFADLKAYHLGRLAAAQNHPAEARKYFQQVINHFPPSSLASWANDALSFLP